MKLIAALGKMVRYFLNWEKDDENEDSDDTVDIADKIIMADEEPWLEETGERGRQAIRKQVESENWGQFLVS